MRKFVRNVPFIYKFIVGCLLLAAVFFVTMLLGAADTSIRDVWLALSSGQTSKTITLIREIRLPRELGAAFVGAGLAVSGAMMQGMTRNPLADPGLLGLTAGANAALALALALLPGANTIVIVFACLIGAAVGTLLVFGIGSLKTGGFSPFRIVLAGAAVSAFLQAVAEGTGLYFHLSKDVAMWTAGGLISTAWPQLQVVMPFILVGLVIAFMLSRQLTILSLNQEVAVGLGQRTTRVRTVMFLVVILLAGAAVALVGNLAFIGLMIPHIVRAFAGTDYRFVLPMAALTGAAFMMLADTLGRTLNAPYETPVAAIVSVLGLPFFLFVVKKGGRSFS